MSNRRVRRNSEEWRELVARQMESGLSVAAFCEREGLSAVSFYQWRSRQSGPTPGPTSAPSSGGAFVDLGGLGGGGRLELRIDLGGGLVLQLARG